MKIEATTSLSEIFNASFDELFVAVKTERPTLNLSQGATLDQVKNLALDIKNDKMENLAEKWQFPMMADRLERRATITLGRLLQWFDYQPEIVSAFAEWILDDDDCRVNNISLQQPEYVDKDGQPDGGIWDGVLTFEDGQFWYIGSDGPSGGSGETMRRRVNPSDTFDVC